MGMSFKKKASPFPQASTKIGYAEQTNKDHNALKRVILKEAKLLVCWGETSIWHRIWALGNGLAKDWSAGALIPFASTFMEEMGEFAPRCDFGGMYEWNWWIKLWACSRLHRWAIFRIEKQIRKILDIRTFQENRHICPS